jgi:hypothetical protein
MFNNGRGAEKKAVKGHTSETAVVLRTLVLALLGFSSPVSHTAELVALGERSVRHAREHVVGRGGGAPAVLCREGGHQVGDRNGSHSDYDRVLCAGQILKKIKKEERLVGRTANVEIN